MFESMRSEVVKASWLPTSRRIAKALGLGAALLIVTAIGTADAQDFSGSWQKVRQGCKPGQLTCRIKAKFTVQNLGLTDAPASTLGVYLSDDAIFDALTDSLLQGIAVGPIDPGGTIPVKMALDLNLGISATGSFLIAVLEGNNVAVFANPGPTGIVLFDKLFGPDIVTINAHTRVRWMHRDVDEKHTVTSGSCDAAGDCVADNIFTSGHIPPDTNALTLFGEFIRVFDDVGEFPYFCEKHEEDMTGTIIVIN